MVGGEVALSVYCAAATAILAATVRSVSFNGAGYRDIGRDGRLWAFYIIYVYMYNST